MEIKFVINKDIETKILEINGYVSQTISVHFERIDCDDYGIYQIKVAYPRDKKPEVLNDEIIMIDDVKNMEYETVINRLFMEMLFSKLFS